MPSKLKLPPYVLKERTRHGKLMYYFRRGKGARTRLPYPHEPTFMPQYLAALTGTPFEQSYIKSTKKEPTTFRWLIGQYQKSAHWLGLAFNSRKSFELHFEHILQKSGDFDYRQITSKHIRLGLETRKTTPASAILFLATMRILFKWAFQQEYIKVNPCLGIERPKHKTDGFKPWTIEDMKKFKSYWKEGSQAHLAFEFLLYTGLRCSDACRAGKQHLKDNIFSIKTQKVGTVITVELPEHLMSLLEITPTGDTTFFINRDKQSMNADQFTRWFILKAMKAGINKSAHGVRKLSATILAEEGATAHELMATYGWKTFSQAETYTKGADRIRLGIKSSRLISSVLNPKNPEPDK
ncbi:MAG: integrase [Candidatus Liberibacter ctenarytainae]|uniref:Integrase n=1 Tax=Candidatus Liberibacter ctenarytainae TaxID=2020335 RepID=A0A937AR29_9HYPH|nr:integrase [Candidatus Liberibacter ctenarytainae]